ncbi:hypothetical protein AB0P06_35625, partial [Kitasatospora sp. NPDC088351]
MHTLQRTRRRGPGRPPAPQRRTPLVIRRPRRADRIEWTTDHAATFLRDDDEPFGTGYDEFTVKGIDPMVGLLPAESLLTGRPEAQLA